MGNKWELRVLAWGLPPDISNFSCTKSLCYFSRSLHFRFHFTYSSSFRYDLVRFGTIWYDLGGSERAHRSLSIKTKEGGARKRGMEGWRQTT